LTGPSEKKILNDSLIAVTALPDTMAWRNNTGMAWQGEEVRCGVGQTLVVQRGMKILRDARPVQFGLLGSGDIMGVTAGRAWALEIKNAKGGQADSQMKFQRAFELAGGQYRLVRSADFAVSFIEGIRRYAPQ
jgi:hypothetical protein